MRDNIFCCILLSTLLLLSGCLSEPDEFTCADGNPVRLADDQWLCDSIGAVAEIPVTNTSYHVDSVTGLDSNPGTLTRPWKTIVKAAATAGPDSTVFIHSGTYDDGPIIIENSGESGKPIVFRAYGFEEPVITTNGMQATGKSHITIANLRFESIRGSNGNGIRIEGRESLQQPAASHVLIKGNTIVNTWSSGIAVWGVKNGSNPGNYQNISNVVIESNTLELNTNGGANEIITVAGGAHNVDVRYNTIREGDFNPDGTPDGTGDEGVDFKEGVHNSRIYGNTFYDLSDKAIYLDGGRGENGNGDAVYNPTVSNIDIFNNRIRDSWGGITVTTEGQGGIDRINIYNNIISNINKDGILVWQHPFGREKNGAVDKVWMFNNTVTNSGQNTLPGDRSWGGIRSSHPQASVQIENNITWGNIGFDLNPNLTNSSIAASNTVVSPTNLCRESFCAYNTMPELTADATPTANSPAIDNGTFPELPDWRTLLPVFGDQGICTVPRGQGHGWDLGAVETLFTNSNAAPELLSFCSRQ